MSKKANEVLKETDHLSGQEKRRGAQAVYQTSPGP